MGTKPSNIRSSWASDTSTRSRRSCTAAGARPSRWKARRSRSSSSGVEDRSETRMGRTGRRRNNAASGRQPLVLIVNPEGYGKLPGPHVVAIHLPESQPDDAYRPTGRYLPGPAPVRSGMEVARCNGRVKKLTTLDSTRLEGGEPHETPEPPAGAARGARCAVFGRVAARIGHHHRVPEQRRRWQRQLRAQLRRQQRVRHEELQEQECREL